MDQGRPSTETVVEAATEVGANCIPSAKGSSPLEELPHDQMPISVASWKVEMKWLVVASLERIYRF